MNLSFSTRFWSSDYSFEEFVRMAKSLKFGAVEINNIDFIKMSPSNAKRFLYNSRVEISSVNSGMNILSDSASMCLFQS